MGTSVLSAEETRRASQGWCRSQGYRIPKWLLRHNVWCPFNRGIIFQGRYGTINARCVGDGDHVVLTFHGLNASHSAFDDYSDVLGNHKHTIVSFDLYGHGLSAIPRYDIFGKSYSLDFFIDQADEVLAYLGLHERKVSVMGVSMGACLAAAFCDRHPERVVRMIMISPAGSIPRCPFMVKVVRFLHCLIPCIPCCVSRCCFSRKLPAGRLDNMTNHMLWRFFVTPKSISGILGIVKRMPMWDCSTLYQRVGALGKPTLILFGKRDKVTPPVAAPMFKRHFTNSHVIVFPDACHLASYMMPTEIASICLAFLAIPPDTRVSDYARWLPFGEDGSYIKERDRVICHSENEPSQQEPGTLQRTPPYEEHASNIAIDITGSSSEFPIELTFSAPPSNVNGERAPDAPSLVLVTLGDYERS